MLATALIFAMVMIPIIDLVGGLHPHVGTLTAIWRLFPWTFLVTGGAAIFGGGLWGFLLTVATVATFPRGSRVKTVLEIWFSASIIMTIFFVFIFAVSDNYDSSSATIGQTIGFATGVIIICVLVIFALLYNFVIGPALLVRAIRENIETKNSVVAFSHEEHRVEGQTDFWEPKRSKSFDKSPWWIDEYPQPRDRITFIE